ncbi:hypothetical protein VNO78_33001 [Psophocarpus tetragonolobus]|uniref:Uncharacterized protein n=1 Tax=Psophocarpus tetragonolobus TaxID=3891 RepID=A0AAN9NW95_PSOTE
MIHAPGQITIDGNAQPGILHLLPTRIFCSTHDTRFCDNVSIRRISVTIFKSEGVGLLMVRMPCSTIWPCSVVYFPLIPGMTN